MKACLFDPQTMKPRITEPVFVDALQQICEGRDGDAGPRRTVAERVVPVLGIRGSTDRRDAASSRNGASAFKLAAWLASADVSTQLDAGGERLHAGASQSLASSSAWHDPGSTVWRTEQTLRRRLRRR